MKFGSTYVPVGWDSDDGLPLINSACVTANDGEIFCRFVDTKRQAQGEADYYATVMIREIYVSGA